MRIPFLGGIGPLELIIILVVVLLIFGPKNLPKLGNAIGRTVKSMRDGMDGGKKKEDAKDEAEEVEAKAQDEVAEPDAQEKDDESESEGAQAGKQDEQEASSKAE